MMNDEELKAYYDKKLEEIPLPTLLKALSVAQEVISPENAEEIRVLHKEYGDSWSAPLHHTWGMWFRNQLRNHGLTDDLLPDENWDDYYCQVVEIAVGVRPFPWKLPI